LPKLLDKTAIFGVKILVEERRTMDAFTRDLLCTHLGDPDNARYLAPLEDLEQEKMAQLMADSVFAAATSEFADGITAEQADRVWEQALVDCRRMLCDEDYLRIFEE
jgi:hypothetical protein